MSTSFNDAISHSRDSVCIAMALARSMEALRA
jgi:hypothetical protein